MMDKNNFKIMSYNSTGMASDKQDFLNEMILKYDPDIIFIQETWLINSWRNVILRNICDLYMADGISVVRDTELMRGRPYGGLAILWKKTLVDIVDYRTIPNTDRVCAIEITCGNNMLLCVNMYMPVDNQRKRYVDTDMMDTIESTVMFIENSGITSVIIGGDINLDLSHHNARDMYFRDFIDGQNLIYTFHLPVADKGYTYYDMANGCKSCIDHISVHYSLCDSVLSIQRCEHALNPSKHLPLVMHISVNIVSREINTDQDPPTELPICWHRVNENHEKKYQRKQEQLLSNIEEYEMSQCDSVNCDSAEHRIQIDQWCAQLVDCCLLADDVLPCVRKQKRNQPNWGEDIKPYKLRGKPALPSPGNP